MNKRILELAEQAEEYVDTVVDQGGEFHVTYTQKFAELLLEEVMQELFINGYEEAFDHLNKHLGVE